MDSQSYVVNEGKQFIVGNLDKQYYCYAIKTKTVTSEDKMQDIIETYVKPFVNVGDIVFVSEKMVACLQGRAILMNSIKPGSLAKTLSKFVTKSPHGIGLSIPQTMQCAIEECGIIRILFAAFISMIGKIFGVKGWFYKIAGKKAASIDGPCEWTLPPYNHYVVLGPKYPDKVALEISDTLNKQTVLIVDLNDLGGEILGSSTKDIDKKYILSMLKQNPLGQSNESTPIGILRPVTKDEVPEA